MTGNMGALDRGVRAFLVTPAAIVLAFVVGAGTVLGIVLFAVAGIMLATSTTGYCPNYTWLGISTDHGLHRTDHGLFHTHAHGPRVVAPEPNRRRLRR